MSATAEFLREHLESAIKETNLPLGKKIHQGKVRDTYEIEGKRVIITTDRQSAFDRVLAAVPFKGQVLNRISNFWFRETREIVPNHILDMPDPNVSVVKKAKVFPVEMIVRGYITGTTDTSAWVNYEKGVREFCGVTLPEGLKKNQKFTTPIITPTTKPETGHDESITPDEILKRKYMTEENRNYVSEKALAVFQRGQEIAAQNGFILVDTKYEFGKDEEGNIMLVDEVHTPDSSRYWKAATYEERLARGEEPEAFDKEFLRLWFVKHCDPYKDEELPEAPEELVVELSRRYIEAFETLTGEEFTPELGGEERIRRNLEGYFGV